MNVVIALCKVLLLLTFAAIALGFGACGAFGLAFSLDSSRIDWAIVGLAMGGLVLMALFGWGTWKMFRAFFPKRHEAGKGGSDFSA